MATSKKSLAPPVKSTQDLEEDWESVRRSKGPVPPRPHPDLTLAAQAISSHASFRIVIDGVSPRITTQSHRTLLDAEEEALETLGKHVRVQVLKLRGDVQETEGTLRVLKEQLAHHEAALPYLPPEPELPDNEVRVSAEDIDTPFECFTPEHGVYDPDPALMPDEAKRAMAQEFLDARTAYKAKLTEYE